MQNPFPLGGDFFYYRSYKKSIHSYYEIIMYLRLAMKKQTYRLDKTAYKASLKSEDQSKSYEYWQKHSIEERLRAATYMIAYAYGYTPDTMPPMDKTYFKKRSRK